MTRRLPILVPIVSIVLAGSLLACSVPVFRYAFEQWRPDAYLAIVFHRGELTIAQQALIDGLRPPGVDGSIAANLDVRTVDLDVESDEVVTALWTEQETETLPWMVVKAPLKHGPPSTVWAGELNEQHAAQLLTSPARRDLQQQLLNGDSVVWVFLDSGDKPADDAAYQVVEDEAARLQQVLELPEIEEADLKDLSLEPGVLKLKMSTVRVSRDDPAEQMLVEMLLRVEPDLRDEPFVNQPMAFPVFGRGRALYALVGNGITAETIEEAGRFLTGACQCTVKAQNPGVDLLLAVDWDRFIQPALPYDTTDPTLAGLTGFYEPDETPVTAAGPSNDEAASPTTDVEVPSEDSIVSNLSELDESPTPGPQPDADATEPATRESVAVEDRAAQDRQDEQTPVVEATSTPSVAGRVVLVMGLLAMCVIVASMVLIPRAR